MTVWRCGEVVDPSDQSKRRKENSECRRYVVKVKIYVTVSKQFSFIDLLDLLDLSDPKGNNSLCAAQGIEPKEPDRI